MGNNHLKRKRWLAAVLGTVLCLLLTGCRNHELENHAFPLALGAEMIQGEDDLWVYLAYPNLQDQKAMENALSSDRYWSQKADSISDAVEEMSENSSQNVDLNHLKVLILDRAMLDAPEQLEGVIAFFEEKNDVAWNTYVILMEKDMKQLFSDRTEVTGSLGTYLEDMLEGWMDRKTRSLTTMGDFMSQYYNETGTLYLPVIGMKEKKPVLKNFVRVEKI